MIENPGLRDEARRVERRSVDRNSRQDQREMMYHNCMMRGSWRTSMLHRLVYR